jgi:endonuclease YncB( thermonuclease family)
MRALILFILLLVSVQARADVVGHPRVIDGDTLEISGTKVRLLGIDAPELQQTCQNKRGRAYDCGHNAARHLRLLIGPKEVTCRSAEQDKDGLLLAVCYVGRHDLNRQMVLEGWALAYRADSDAYIREELAARHLKDGLWKGRFVPPWDWRGGTRLGVEPR